MPRGEAEALARELRLGEHHTASLILLGRPEPTWIEAARGDRELPEATTDSGTLLWPVPKGRRGRGFGRVRRRALRHINHDGVDIPAPMGAPVRAADDGLVVYADNGVRGYGNLVLIVHPDGSATVYAHLRASYVFAGQRVGRGQHVGEVGSTGLSYAPHLHFEWHERGRARNPARRFVDAPPPGSGRRG